MFSSVYYNQVDFVQAAVILVSGLIFRASSFSGVPRVSAHVLFCGLRVQPINVVVVWLSPAGACLLVRVCSGHAFFVGTGVFAVMPTLLVSYMLALHPSVVSCGI